MIAPLRRAHRASFSVLAICLPIALMAAIVNRPSGPSMAGPASDLQTDERGTISGCWGELPVRLTYLPREAETDGAAKEDRTRSHDEAVGGVELHNRYARVVHPLPEAAATLQVEMLGSPLHPDLLAYWLQGIGPEAENLASNGLRLARVHRGRPVEIARSSIPEQGATLALYSLGLAQVVGTLELHRDAIVLESCR